MDRDTWRISVVFDDRKDAKTVFEQLHDAAKIESVGGSLTEPGWDTLYAYGSTREQVEQVVSLIRSELRFLQLAPESFVIDQWIPEESRWGGDRRPGRLDSGGGDRIDVLLAGLLYDFPWVT